jgi:hypothetical protein
MGESPRGSVLVNTVRVFFELDQRIILAPRPGRLLIEDFLPHEVNHGQSGRFLQGIGHPGHQLLIEPNAS